jgi:hypothetical protein
MHPLVPTNPAASQEVLAGCVEGLFRSIDGATSWAAIALPALPAGLEPNRLAACHAPSNTVAGATASTPAPHSGTSASGGPSTPKWMAP